MSHVRITNRENTPQTVSGVRRSRRLSDKILMAFHLACDQGELDIAADLLRCCEAAIRCPAQQPCDRRAADELLIAAFERLWFLRHPGADAWDGDMGAATLGSASI